METIILICKILAGIICFIAYFYVMSRIMSKVEQKQIDEIFKDEEEKNKAKIIYRYIARL
jgi:hypothetical protein